MVVGSSAGGVEALSTLVASLPADLPAAVVIAQHLAPDRLSHLGDILSRRSALPVRTVDATEALAAATIYVVPANRHVSITDHEVSVHADESVRPAPSVDLLLSSAAEVFADRLVAVILTGSGSDGAAGAHVVKEAGGTVIIQDPETAAFPSMPRSLAPPLVDIVASLDRIGPILAELLDGVALAEDGEGVDDLSGLLARLRERRGVDFTGYRTPTIQRRLRRRMAATGVSSIPSYLGFLDEHPEEEQRLVADFLIKVTRFFRDAELFDEMRATVLPELIAAAAQEGRELRIWSAGCATGEEAYSLALLVADLVAEHGEPRGIRIFATDLDENAVGFARRGIYPASVLSEVPPELVARHFVEHKDGFEVRKQVRSLIVFGHHDLGQRPPFANMDLVLCRNVLIYFTPELQRRAMDLFVYALRDAGYLVLGKAETPGSAETSFTPVARRLRIYRRTGPRTILLPGRLPNRLPSPAEMRPARPPAPTRSASALQVALDQAEGATREARLIGDRAEDLIRRLPIGVVVVDRGYGIASINGAARELLGIHGTAVGQDLIHLAQRLPSTALRAAVDAVARSEPPHQLDTVVTAETATGETRHLSISCHPSATNADGSVATVLVLITDVTAASQAQRLATEEMIRFREAAGSLRSTTERLAGANRQLLAANRELTDSVDQLQEGRNELLLATLAAQVSTEEIETLNEELQSSNEELETLHEEAQATVEELNVANEQLQARAVELEEMAAAQSGEQARLAAILAGMADAVLVVDHQGRPVLVNAAYRALGEAGDHPLVPIDERGVPLPAADTPQRRVARGEEFRMDFTAVGADGARRWFEAIGRPLSGAEAGVLVIRDITDRSLRRLQEEFLAWAGHELRTPLTVLQSCLHLAERRAGPDADARLRSYLATAVTQSQRQGVLIDELLDATRLRSGRLALTRGRLDLGALVHRVAEIGQVIATGQTIVVETPETPVAIEADAGRLEQVLLNLLTNAIAYAPGTERIEVEVRPVEGGAEVSVRDHGPGIRPEMIGQIFDRFTRADASTQPSTGGLGLGLFISREIVRTHGGSLDVESAPGEGATFTLRLPATAADPATDPSAGATA